MTPAQKLKDWNDKLFCQMLAWKDTHPKMYQAATSQSKVESLYECSTEELLSIAILTIQQGIK